MESCHSREFLSETSHPFFTLVAMMFSQVFQYRKHGIRFSRTDAAVILLTIVLAVLTFESTAGLCLLGVFVVGHFFLFCNIFRIRRTPELIWAGLFVLNCGIWASFGSLNLWGICGTQLVVTLVILVIEIRAKTYHGVFSRQLNPHLDDYLAGRN